MNRAITFTFVSILLSAMTLGCHSNSDIAGVTAAKQDFFKSWTKLPGERFSTAKLSAVVENSDDFLSFDGMSQGQTVIQTWAGYQSIWQPGINSFTSANLSEQKALRTWVSGDLAITASIARISGETADGKKLDMPGHLTLGWQRQDGKWQLVHEHMSLNVKE